MVKKIKNLQKDKDLEKITTEVKPKGLRTRQQTKKQKKFEPETKKVRMAEQNQRTIIVTNFSPKTQRRELLKFFSSYGKVRSFF